MQLERRKSARKKSRNLLSFDLIGSKKGNTFNRSMGCTRNISSKGLLLETHMPMTYGRAMLLSINLEGEILELRGKVVRVNPREGRRYFIGIEFVDLNPHEESELLEFLKLGSRAESREALLN